MRSGIKAGLLSAAIAAGVLVPTAAFAATPQTAPKPAATTHAVAAKPPVKKTRQAATTLTVAASDTQVTAGGPVTLSGTLSSGRSGVSGETVKVYFKGAGDRAYAYVTSTSTGFRGRYSASVTADESGTWKVAFSGTADKAASSATVEVATRRNNKNNKNNKKNDKNPKAPNAKPAEKNTADKKPADKKSADTPAKAPAKH